MKIFFYLWLGWEWLKWKFTSSLPTKKTQFYSSASSYSQKNKENKNPILKISSDGFLFPFFLKLFLWYGFCNAAFPILFFFLSIYTLIRDKYGHRMNECNELRWIAIWGLWFVFDISLQVTHTKFVIKMGKWFSKFKSNKIQSTQAHALGLRK